MCQDTPLFVGGGKVAERNGLNCRKGDRESGRHRFGGRFRSCGWRSGDGQPRTGEDEESTYVTSGVVCWGRARGDNNPCEESHWRTCARSPGGTELSWSSQKNNEISVRGFWGRTNNNDITLCFRHHYAFEINKPENLKYKPSVPTYIWDSLANKQLRKKSRSQTIS